jgi:hypothetical protein
MPVAFIVGRIRRRRINGGKGYTTKQQMKHLGVGITVYLLLMVAAALINSGKLALP